MYKFGKHSMEGPAARYPPRPCHGSCCTFSDPILAASSNATTFNERMHSLAGCIFSDLRNSLEPSSVKNLTLALFYVRKWVKEKMRQKRGAREREPCAGGGGRGG